MYCNRSFVFPSCHRCHLTKEYIRKLLNIKNLKLKNEFQSFNRIGSWIQLFCDLLCSSRRSSLDPTCSWIAWSRFPQVHLPNEDWFLPCRIPQQVYRWSQTPRVRKEKKQQKQLLFEFCMFVCVFICVLNGIISTWFKINIVDRVDLMISQTLLNKGFWLCYFLSSLHHVQVLIISSSLSARAATLKHQHTPCSISSSSWNISCCSISCFHSTLHSFISLLCICIKINNSEQIHYFVSTIRINFTPVCNSIHIH